VACNERAPDSRGQRPSVVILNTAFGTSGTAKAPFNKGRTATHEVGHYLNLRHIWGDTEDCSGGDLVNRHTERGDGQFR
jgi:hypothetical protein